KVIYQAGKPQTASLNATQIFPVVTAVGKFRHAVSQHLVVGGHVSQRGAEFVVENLQDVFLERFNVALPRLFALVGQVQLSVNERQQLGNNKRLGNVQIGITQP